MKFKHTASLGLDIPFIGSKAWELDSSVPMMNICSTHLKPLPEIRGREAYLPYMFNTIPADYMAT